MSKRGRDEDVAHAIALVRGSSDNKSSSNSGNSNGDADGDDSKATCAEGAAVTLTPLERQVVALKTRLPRHVLLLVACGYRVKAYGRDARVMSRRCGVACIRAGPFEYCSVPYTRVSLYVHRLVAMGYHVSFADQESSVMRASVGVRGGLFARTLSRLYSRATLLPSEAVATAGSTAATAASAANAAVAVVAAASRRASGGRGGNKDENDDADDDADMANGNDDDGDNSGNEEGKDADDAQQQQLWSTTTTMRDAAMHSELHMCFLAPCTRLMQGAKDEDNNGEKHNNKAHAARTTTVVVRAVLVSFVTRRRVSFVLHTALALEDVLQRYSIVEVVVVLPRAAPARTHRTARGDDNMDAAAWLRALPESFATVLQQTLPLHYGPTLVGEEDDKTVSVNGCYYHGDDDAASATAAASLDTAIAAYLAAYGLQDVYTQLCSVRSSEHEDSDDTRGGGGAAAASSHATSGDEDVAVLQLPGSTLRALDVFHSGSSGSRARGAAAAASSATGSLLSLLDHTLTVGGARRLREWVAAPLARRAAIIARQAAVTYLLRGGDGGAAEALLRECARAGDVDAIVSKVYACTCSVVEWARLLACVRAAAARAREWLATTTTTTDTISKAECCSDGCGGPGRCGDAADMPPPLLLQTRLRSVCGDAVMRFLRQHTVDLTGATTPLELYTRTSRSSNNSTDTATTTTTSLDHRSDEDDDEERAEALAAMRQHTAARDAAAAALAAELERARRVLGLPGLAYRTIAATTWVLDVPAAKAERVPAEWLVLSRTRSHVRYHTPTIQAQNTLLCAANEQLASAAARAWRAQLSRLTRCADDAAVLRTAVDVVADVDALRSLARASARGGYVAPELFDMQDGDSSSNDNKANSDDDAAAQLCIRDGRHPMLDVLLPNGYVSCSVRLAVGGAWLLTGPNMGGKSALMRMMGLFVVLAQLGCYVPASAARLPVFAGVYCRMGASDSILEGRSTFLSEMDETARLLRAPALSCALVLMDELGRGTSSFDGAAVAAATLDYLVQHRATTLFVTHYNFICTPYCNGGDTDNTTTTTRRVACYYMGFRTAEATRTTTTAAATVHDEHDVHARSSLVFTYQPCRGVTPSSFGVAIAEMAGLPARVTREARLRSLHAEAASTLRTSVAQLRRVLRHGTTHTDLCKP